MGGGGGERMGGGGRNHLPINVFLSCRLSTCLFLTSLHATEGSEVPPLYREARVGRQIRFLFKDWSWSERSLFYFACCQENHFPTYTY